MSDFSVAYFNFKEIIFLTGKVLAKFFSQDLLISRL